MSKEHNASLPIIESVQTLNRYGLEIVSGIILGLDTDRPDSGERILDFMDESKIPMLTVNLLQALPKTPLWTRLEAAGRIDDDETRESNVVFRLPYDDVVAMWKVGRARDAAWVNGETLWALRGLPKLRAEYASTLDRMVGFAGRGLLRPL